VILARRTYDCACAYHLCKVFGRIDQVEPSRAEIHPLTFGFFPKSLLQTTHAPAHLQSIVTSARYHLLLLAFSYVAPANYFAAITETRETAEATAQIFMGSRIQCARCHNHPFENWTQDDYYSIGTVFHGIQTEGTSVKLASNRMMANPRTGQSMKPWGMKPEKLDQFASDQLVDARDDFAHWLTSSDNDYFSKVEVNRIWAHLFGRGIVNPVDDFRSSNPPSNVELLEALSQDFVTHQYDRKHIFRVICNSQTYQRTSQTTSQNERDEELFSHQRCTFSRWQY